MLAPELPSFFALTRDEQHELLQGAAYRTPWSIKMLEKDVWVVWTLDALFRPNAPRYAFKGGACLSKVYGAIHRFQGREGSDYHRSRGPPRLGDVLGDIEGESRAHERGRDDTSDHANLRTAQRFLDART